MDFDYRTKLGFTPYGELSNSPLFLAPMNAPRGINEKKNSKEKGK